MLLDACISAKPRVNLTRFHGVFAPNSKHRVTITPAGRGKGSKAHLRHAGISATTDTEEVRSPMEQRAAMTWARRLKRVFRIDITECERCRGPVRIIASVEESLPRERSECFGHPAVIKQILDHLARKEGALQERKPYSPPSRAPTPAALSQRGLFE